MNLDWLSKLKNPYVYGGGLAGIGAADMLVSDRENTPIADLALGTGLGVLGSRVPGVRNRVAGFIDQHRGKEAFEKALGEKRGALGARTQQLGDIENELRVAAAARKNQLAEARRLRDEISANEATSALHGHMSPAERAQELLLMKLGRARQSGVAGRPNIPLMGSQREELLSRLRGQVGNDNWQLADKLSRLKAELGDITQQGPIYRENVGAKNAARKVVKNDIASIKKQILADQVGRDRTNQQLATLGLAGLGTGMVMGADYLNPYGG